MLEYIPYKIDYIYANVNLVNLLNRRSSEIELITPKEGCRVFDCLLRMERFRVMYSKYYKRLSEREKEVLKHMAEGFNNAQIAKRLHISRSTVETHRKNLKRKLDIKSYRDVIRYALAFNLIQF